MDSAEAVFYTINSTQFRASMHYLSIICMVMAVGFVCVAFAYYGRTRERNDVSAEAQRWTMLFATWRDSLIITLLYLSQGMIWRASDFSGVSQVIPNTVFLYMPLMAPVLLLITDVLMFVVVAMRIIVLTMWLSKKDS